MTIVCGTDFSEGATGAARVAAAIAARLGQRLELVHSIEGAGDPSDVVSARLREIAARLKRELGVDRVEPVVERGEADERLVERANSVGARLVVVGSLGERSQARWLVGSVAERVAQTSSVPVLVVRDAARLEGWASGERTLRVVVAVELTEIARAALRWAKELSAVGPCALTVARIAWPAAEHQRLGIATPMPLDHLVPGVEEQLLRELREWASGVPGAEGAELLVRCGWGRVDVHLAQLAAELDADLLVVGTTQRAAIARLWQRSVSRGVLHEASMNVACVPLRS